MPGTSGIGDVERASLPFSAMLSLAPLIEFWRAQGTTDHDGPDPVRHAVEDALNERPELGEPIEDLSLLHKHRSFVDLLMTAVFPPATSDRDLSAALVPFEARIFYATPVFYRLFGEEDAIVSGRVKLDVQAFMYNKILAGYLHILRTVYGEEISFEYPTIVTATDPQSSLDRYYKITSDLRFMKIKETGERHVLSEKSRRYLLANLSDLSVWLDLIPPDRFEFYGFTIVKAVDVTDEQVISALRRDLLEGGGTSGSASLESTEKHLRIYLQSPDVNLGLASVDDHDAARLERVSGGKDDCLFGDASRVPLVDLQGSIFERAVRHRAIFEIEDIEAHGELAPFEDEVSRKGIRSILVAPLFFHGELIGVLYLWSRTAFALNELNGIKLREVLPLFSATVKRGREELRSRVQAVILGQYTAIHPSVEWRFRKAALKFIREMDGGHAPEPEPIVFHEVYPLYGATDIRGSSEHRNASVQSDLLDQMAMIDEILRLARDIKPLPILDHLLGRSEQFRETIEQGLSSGDEAGVRDFLVRDVEPLFEHVQTFGPSVSEKIQQYVRETDPASGNLHRRRRAFDQSVSLINQTISEFLDEEEQKAQALFPHYFEKHQTDGVEYTIYVGASLNENATFNALYVRNLRLWQLLVTCEVARRVHAVKAEMKTPLDTTHLILTQRTPLSIRFRFDERRFDVDGAYNILFEIMKRRVDKALLKGDPEERLTQPDRIAIVYAQPREAWEYGEYIETLQRWEFLADDVEEVELDDLQGMKGLKALRVRVKMEREQRHGLAPDLLAQVLERPLAGN